MKDAQNLKQWKATRLFTFPTQKPKVKIFTFFIKPKVRFWIWQANKMFPCDYSQLHEDVHIHYQQKEKKKQLFVKSMPSLPLSDYY